jgi:hypothetical protein
MLQKLDYSQFLLTVATASKGTHCVIKTFTPFMRGKHNEGNYESGYFVSLLYLYSLLFDEIHLYKPYASNPTSGEYYIIGKSFKEELKDEYFNILVSIQKSFKENNVFFPKELIPDEYVYQLYNFIDNINNYNIKHQEKLYYFVTCLNDDEEFKKETGCLKLLDEKNINNLHKNRFEQWIKLFNFR